MHSTETALIRVHNDIIRQMDTKKCVALVLLDLSAAFDTIDQEILMSRLKHLYGIQGSALTWISTYRRDHTQAIQLDCSGGSASSQSGHVRSTTTSLPHGVPQGSVLGPLLFTLYTAPLSYIIADFGLHHYLYADDTQIYIAVEDGQETATKVTIENCCAAIKRWMDTNKLKLNDSKTEILLCGTKHQVSNVKLETVIVGDSSVKIEKSNSVRNLGVFLENNLSMQTHVNKVCQAAYFHLRNISSVRKYLDEHATKILIHSLITSRLDYCNSLLLGAPKIVLDKLQKVQNRAARLVTLTKMQDHIQPVLFHFIGSL